MFPKMYFQHKCVLVKVQECPRNKKSPVVLMPLNTWKMNLDLITLKGAKQYLILQAALQGSLSQSVPVKIRVNHGSRCFLTEIYVYSGHRVHISLFSSLKQQRTPVLSENAFMHVIFFFYA